MFVKVLFFGLTAELAGRREADVEFSAGETSDVILRRVIEIHPSLSGRKLLFAVNQKYADGAEMISESDELAVFTAVSGG